MKKIYKLILVLSLFLPVKLFASVVPETSWITKTYYQIDWCSPHSEIWCKQWYFENIWWVWVLTYEWASTSGINILEDTASVTVTQDVWIIDLFDVDELHVQWEWTYTITVILMDKAENASSYTFVYKVDKTAPQFELSSIEENTAYTYVDDRIEWLNWTVEKYDSNTQSSSADNYPEPSLSNYSWDSPFVTESNRLNLNPFYYSWNDWSENFALNTTYSDDYNWHLNSVYLAWEKNFELLDSSNTSIKKDISLSTALSLATSDLNNWTNSRKTYKLRLYDQSEWKDWWDNNYSEVTFYVVRDNTTPNTSVIDLIEFNDGVTIWDTWITNLNYSRFLEANDNQELIFYLDDTWIAGWGDQPELANAWIEVGEVKVNIEKAWALNSFDTIIEFPNRFDNSNISKIVNFSDVDLNRKNGYRNYLTQFISQWGLSWICDAVWNCLESDLEFRVVASELDYNESLISLTNSWDKMYANWEDYYSISTKLKDKYWNAIVWAKAVENDWTPDIKKVDLQYTFMNWLYENLIWEIGEWEKQVWIINNQIDDDISESVNNDWKVYFEEDIEDWTSLTKWIYSFKINSKVPTNWLYQYLWDDAKLLLSKFESKTSDESRTSVWFYGDLWNYDNSLDFEWYINLFNFDRSFLENSLYHTDFSIDHKDTYWDITLVESSDVSIAEFESNKKIQLEYAPLYVYWADDFTVHHLINNIWQYSNHTKKAYELDPDNVDSVEIFEKYLPSYSDITIEDKKYTPNIFNIYSSLESQNWVIINDWDTIDLVWEDLYYTKSSPINSDYLVSWFTANMWYVSHITYNVSWKTIKIPSISRNISDTAEERKDIPENNSYCYFPESSWEWTWNYKIVSDSIINTWLLSSMWIAITWLSNSYDSMLWDDAVWTKATVNLWENLTRYDLIKDFKLNMSKKSMWIEWCDLSTINNLNEELWNCTTTINWEMISFIEWNVDIDCWLSWVCELNNNIKRTIIVKGGSVYIKSNITTYWKNSQLLIWSLSEYWLENIPSTVDLDSSNVNIDRNQSYTNWWMFIDPSITNIDSFLVAQWPVVTYDWSQLFNEPVEWDLANQLHIYWWLLSLNTVGGYKTDDDSKCPYIVTWTCNSKTAFIFDLITLRRYSLEWASEWSEFVIVSWWWLRSGRHTENIYVDINSDIIEITSADTCSPSSDTLRCITDLDYIVYPLLVEKDNVWVKNPSIMFDNY